MSLSGAIGSHVVVVDDVNLEEGSVRIRDPYHGWEITVTEDSFLKEWSDFTRSNDSILQIKEKDA